MRLILSAPQRPAMDRMTAFKINDDRVGMTPPGASKTSRVTRSGRVVANRSAVQPPCERPNKAVFWIFRPSKTSSNHSAKPGPSQAGRFSALLPGSPGRSTAYVRKCWLYSTTSPTHDTAFEADPCNSTKGEAELSPLAMTKVSPCRVERVKVSQGTGQC